MQIDNLEVEISDLRGQITNTSIEKTGYNNELEVLRKQLMNYELQKSQKVEFK